MNTKSRLIERCAVFITQIDIYWVSVNILSVSEGEATRELPCAIWTFMSIYVHDILHIKSI
jgi:hypothetical protein